MSTTETKPCKHGGVAVRCAHCGNDEFRVREYALRTMEDEMFRLPWAADRMRAYICGRCGSVQWFAGDPAVSGKNPRPGVAADKIGG